MADVKVLKPLTAQIILKERGWILEKMAHRLVENLKLFNVHAQLADSPSPSADINHWMIYYDVFGKLYPGTTIAITHVDRPAKLHILKRRLLQADLGICMSRMTLEQLVFSGIPRKKLCYISPAYDGQIQTKRTVIGLNTQIRPDGAKREYILIELAKSMRLDTFHFSIVGPRWEKVIPYFEASGATVDYSPGLADNNAHQKMVLDRLASLDYYLYMGWDEGSMGLLDALAAGIPTITTPQGFHLDIDYGITHSFRDSSDLLGIFQKLAAEKQNRINAVAKLTWKEYARNHALVWRGIRENNLLQVVGKLHADKTYFIATNDLVLDAKSSGYFPHYTRNTLQAFLSDLYLLFDYYSGGRFGSSIFYRWGKSLKKLLVGKKK